MITRALLPQVVKTLKESGKGVVIYGARQVGKTTLANEVIKTLGGRTLVLNGDQRGDWWDLLISREISKLRLLLSGYDVLLVDEAQRIPEIGLSLKIILDNFKQLRVIVTGSSSLDLASKVAEPLTGRVYSYKMWPISMTEMANVKTSYELHEELEERLIYGSYPEIFSRIDLASKNEYLRNLLDAYLYKDLLEFGDVRNSSKIRDLLKLLAFQVGSQVSLNELSSNLGLSRTTVDRYIDLLEKSFVVFRLSGFSRNLRKEVKRMDKIYFNDLGIRNALIANLNFIKDRDDVGKLWENFLMIERVKRMSYKNKSFSHYYWRLSSGAELDLVEDCDGVLSGFEFKYSHKTVKPPKSWLESYPKSNFRLVNKDNWLEFTKD